MTLEKIATKAITSATTKGVMTAVEKIRQKRDAAFYESMSFSLLNEGLTTEQISTLLEKSLDDNQRELIYQGAMKSLLSNSLLAVQMIAVLTAKQLLENSNSESMKNQRLLRALITIDDNEVLFLDKVVSKYWELSGGKPAVRIGGMEDPDSKIRILGKTSIIAEQLNENDSSQYDEIIPTLRTLGVVETDFYGSSSTTALISSFTEEIVRLYKVTQGFPNQETT